MIQQIWIWCCLSLLLPPLTLLAQVTLKLKSILLLKIIIDGFSKKFTLQNKWQFKNRYWRFFFFFGGGDKYTAAFPWLPRIYWSQRAPVSQLVCLEWHPAVLDLKGAILLTGLDDPHHLYSGSTILIALEVDAVDLNWRAGKESKQVCSGSQPQKTPKGISTANAPRCTLSWE